MKRHRRKIITRVLVFLLLGAIVNVAVAWGCAITHNGVWHQGVLDNYSSQRLWLQHAPKEFPLLPDGFVGTMCYRLGSTWEAVMLDRRPQPPGNAIFLVGRSSFGMPFHSLFGIVVTTDFMTNSPGTQLHSFVQSPIRVSHPQVHSGYVPIGVAIPGFAINTMFYAAVLWMMFAMPSVVRRYVRGRRIMRGLCPACAYPVGKSPVCTECGAALSSRLLPRGRIQLQEKP